MVYSTPQGLIFINVYKLIMYPEMLIFYNLLSTFVVSIHSVYTFAFYVLSCFDDCDMYSRQEYKCFFLIYLY